MIYQVSFIHRFTFGAEEELKKEYPRKTNFENRFTLVRTREARHGDRAVLSIFAGAGEATAAAPNVATI
jgi:hypothetical protein